MLSAPGTRSVAADKMARTEGGNPAQANQVVAKEPGPPHNPLQIPMAIFFYSVCSSTMLLANKLAVGGIAPTVLGAVQMAFAVATCCVLSLTGAEPNIDSLRETPKVKAYAVYALSFVAAIYANMRALAMSNVETVIVFRSASPIAVSVLDWYFLGRQLPNLRSTGALLTIVIGAVVYASYDSQIALDG